MASMPKRIFGPSSLTSRRRKPSQPPVDDADEGQPDEVSAFVRVGEKILADQLAHKDLTNTIKSISNRITSAYPFVRVEALKQLMSILRTVTAASINPMTGHPIDSMMGLGVPNAMQQSWAATQQVLTTNLINPMFHRIFPRRELLLALVGGGGIPLPVLSREAALQWTPCTKPAVLVQLSDAAEDAANAGIEAVAVGMDDAELERVIAANNPMLPTQGDETLLVEPNLKAASQPLTPQEQTAAKIARQHSIQKGLLAARAALYDVSLYEQDMALRIIQGLCVIAPQQKVHVSESPLLAMLIESCNCCLQHVQQLALLEREIRTSCSDVVRQSAMYTRYHEALLAQQRQDAINTAESQRLLRHEGASHSRHPSAVVGNDSEDEAFAGSVSHAELRSIDPTQYSSGVPGSSSATTMYGSGQSTSANVGPGLNGPDTARPFQRDAEQRVPHAPGGFHGGGTQDHPEVITMRPELLAMMCALIDAVEAACHYCSKALGSLVQFGGIKHLLTLACCPYTPSILRCAIFDSISLLMKETDPFRRAVLSGGNNAEPLPAMTPAGDEAKATQFYMDRATASKFDSAVRSWLSANHLFACANSLLALRDVGGVEVPTSVSRTEAQRIAHKANRQRERMFTEFITDVNQRLIGTV